MPKVDINALDQECVKKFQHYIEHQCFPPHQNQRNKSCFRNLVFFLNNILLVLHPFLSLFCFVYVHMNRLGFGILIPFSKSVALSMIMHFFLATTSVSCCPISIALHYASAIVCTFMACCTINCTFVDRCSSCATTFSSFASFCTVYASTK